MSLSIWDINEHSLEFEDETHTYICDGIIVPSITQALKFRFKNKYAGIDKDTLKRASEKGTEVHEAIEKWCRDGVESDLPEVKNFKFLQNQYGFEVLDNELPVILSVEDEPILAGRLDLVMKLYTKGDEIGLADIKRTSSLDKEYLGLQLNLYRLAFQQCYNKEISFLRGIHLRDDLRKFVNIPINEQYTWDFIKDWRTNGNL